jgi:hypothetical protein
MQANLWWSSAGSELSSRPTLQGAVRGRDEQSGNSLPSHHPAPHLLYHLPALERDGVHARGCSFVASGPLGRRLEMAPTPHSWAPRRPPCDVLQHYTCLQTSPSLTRPYPSRVIFKLPQSLPRARSLDPHKFQGTGVCHCQRQQPTASRVDVPHRLFQTRNTIALTSLSWGVSVGLIDRLNLLYRAARR